MSNDFDHRRRIALELLPELEDNTERMWPGASQFVMDMADKRDTWGADRLFVSEAQLKWLQDLHDRFCQ